MKRILSIVLLIVVVVSVTACENADGKTDIGISSTPDTTQSEKTTSDADEADMPNESDLPSGTESDTTQKGKENVMNIQIENHSLTATLVENSSTQALINLLKQVPITINMHDYANMEKVGPLPQNLPRNDEQINTDAGDLILYQGNSFVIYYDTNSWNFTRLGKIDNVTKQELRNILGSGNVIAVLSLQAN